MMTLRYHKLIFSCDSITIVVSNKIRRVLKKMDQGLKDLRSGDSTIGVFQTDSDVTESFPFNLSVSVTGTTACRY